MEKMEVHAKIQLKSVRGKRTLVWNGKEYSELYSFVPDFANSMNLGVNRDLTKSQECGLWYGDNSETFPELSLEISKENVQHGLQRVLDFVADCEKADSAFSQTAEIRIRRDDDGYHVSVS